MKNKFIAIASFLLAMMLIAGCSGVSKVKAPAAKMQQKSYEIYDLYLTQDANQMSGVAKDNVKLSPGETITVYVRGCSTPETGGKWFILPEDVKVEWIADRELAVTPSVGHVVQVKLVEKPSVSSYLKAVATTKEGKKFEKLLTVVPK